MCSYQGNNIFEPSSNDATKSLFEAFSPMMRSRLPWESMQVG